MIICLLAVTIPLQYLARNEVVVGLPSGSAHNHAVHEEGGHEHTHEHEHTEDEGHLATEVPLGVNLIPNYGFEVGTREQVWGWKSRGMEEEGIAYRDTGVAHGGLASAALSTAGETVDGAGWYMRLDELPLDHVVILEGYVRTQALAGAAYFMITLEKKDENGRSEALGWVYSDAVTGDSEWTFRHISIYVPPETTGVWLEAGMSGSGSAWFDDLYLVVEEPE